MVDVYPIRGTHTPGEQVELSVTSDTGGLIRASITHLDRTVATLEKPTTGSLTTLNWNPPGKASRGYGVDVELVDDNGGQIGEASTAFDVADDWTRFPRYGFLSDFPPDRNDWTETIGTLARYHLNALQFYDWQYRHDDLVAPTDVYTDPLGRTLSLTTIRKAIDAAHAGGMAAMAYVAIYAASVRFWQQRLEWALYDETGEPLSFGEDFLGLMNPTRPSPWAKHLLEQCGQALDAGFDGIHIDQYGEPRTGFDAAGGKVDLPAAFADFIAELKTHHPHASTTMNAVKNWPIQALAQSSQDFVYIELWPDTPTYQQVLDIVLRARSLSDKPVVVAIYLPADQTANVTTLDAILTAAGAWRIELGEQGRLLTDPYFPNHQAIPSPLATSIRRHNDFAVRYLELCGPPAHHEQTITAATPEGTHAVTRSSGRRTGVSLVNIANLTTRWDQAHPAPPPHQDLEVVIAGSTRVDTAWYATPEQPTSTQLAVSPHGDGFRVEVPRLDRYGLIWFETKEERR
ncbi:MAG TPA: glycoside hydrolase family 66 protein [Acidimicrobiia bacterium]|nr:glycoside hydrolase family 66 protein [Acidimicrobiia bacterium]